MIRWPVAVEVHVEASFFEVVLHGGEHVLPPVLTGQQHRGDGVMAKVGGGDELALVEHLDGAETAQEMSGHFVAGGVVDGLG